MILCPNHPCFLDPSIFIPASVSQKGQQKLHLHSPMSHPCKEVFRPFQTLLTNPGDNGLHTIGSKLGDYRSKCFSRYFKNVFVGLQNQKFRPLLGGPKAAKKMVNQCRNGAGHWRRLRPMDFSATLPSASPSSVPPAHAVPCEDLRSRPSCTPGPPPADGMAVSPPQQISMRKNS